MSREKPWTPGPWKAFTGVSSVGMGRNGISHHVSIGGQDCIVGFTEEVTGDVERIPLDNGLARQVLVNRREPQRNVSPDARLIAKAPTMADQLEANTKWLIAERDSLYECITDAEGNIPDDEDGEYLKEMDKIIDANRALLAEIYGDTNGGGSEQSDS